mmetsp:Transcript_8882/g.21929  ORF Transcript_8882/g.21929 Transcript_8882/m.21929 type:complete len:234 (-) Transcript_8882:73-774(-)
MGRRGRGRGRRHQRKNPTKNPHRDCSFVTRKNRNVAGPLAPGSQIQQGDCSHHGRCGQVRPELQSRPQRAPKVYFRSSPNRNQAPKSRNRSQIQCQPGPETRNEGLVAGRYGFRRRERFRKQQQRGEHDERDNPKTSGKNDTGPAQQTKTRPGGATRHCRAQAAKTIRTRIARRQGGQAQIATGRGPAKRGKGEACLAKKGIRARQGQGRIPATGRGKSKVRSDVSGGTPPRD